MSSDAASPGSSPNVGSATAGSTAQQANTMTRNFILGIPKEGLAADSAEAADLQAAEAFVSDIQQEILAYDIANAKAMEAYATKWWSKVPYFGRHAKRALEYEAAAAATKATSTTATSATHGSAGATPATPPGSSGLHLTPEEAAAAMQVGGTYLHKQTSQTSRGFKVERTSAIDPAHLAQFTQAGNNTAGGGAAAVLPPPPKVNSWLFRRQHPGWVPLMQRWWVPWLCMGSIVLIWTPDVWKLRWLYICDHQYALLRQAIHKAYWRATMDPADYAALMADIEAERPSTVSATNCPFE
ncbi:putative mitochondrial hypothetical protein [Leptomonas pyrrhocoris]|uniref:Uncharacterized protein n=1 Tax=Leptomonas pyrrhocoris TaxID=157538 RepID=A0A0M9G716_LEPPY|nr:putative mitochondrial hypothetical protein [Leptomonas pyrrhocoris]XP_015662086.1 putative mitochondrial hypothetical protein [Leptomonas pyrrhocoris]KPA83646.1 putative mitochondrial hypothetical protein [Leptomonas pyrrhocoris]KPA83647.1 putative mitochondrial hypothetical protein [Leptomonas pyrrhocoris]|eukprot:XP_015662085.1 putative mitochondrial hypothetical protein [Leptomonas pyrrhocoris]